MEILSIADAVTTTLSTTSPGSTLGFDKSFPITVTRILSISAGLSDTIERPRIRHNRSRSIPRSFTRKKRRTRKRSQTSDGGDSDDGGEGNSFFGDGNEGPFGGGGGGGFGNGGGGGGGGKGWNFDGYEGSDWDDASDPAFDFVYKVLSWIILSNCLHFAFKKVVRIIADGAIGDPSREKVV